MASSAPAGKFRRRLLWLGTGLLLGVVTMFLFRAPLSEAAVINGLRRAGAGDIRLLVAEVTPWTFRMEKLSFRIKTRTFTAERVTVQREHWWKPSLGLVKIEGAEVPVTVDGSDANPFAWTSYAGDAPASGGGGAVVVPVDKLSIDGRLIVKTSQHNQPVTFTFVAEPGSGSGWNGTVEATGPGLKLSASGSYGLNDGKWQLATKELAVDLQAWSSLLQQLAVVPMGPWNLSGRLTATLQGGNATGHPVITGHVQLQDAALKNEAGNIEATGVAADLEFADFNKMVSAQPGSLTVRELRTGKLISRDFTASVSFIDAEHLTVHQAEVKLLGGKATAEPFTVALAKHELEAVIMADSLEMGQILALTENLPAQATGSVNGRLPLRLDEQGLRLGTGWLELKKGVYAEVQLKAAGLITAGMSPNDTSYVVMKRVETGLLQLKLGALRLEVRPPDAPRGRSARLHLEGEPTDPNIKIPVVLDVNVNGPLEQLLNFSMNQNISFRLGN